MGKGSKWRKTDFKKYDLADYWVELEKRKKQSQQTKKIE